jgi:hypothetical protein
VPDTKFTNYGTLDTILDTGLNSLASGSAALTAAIDNSSAGGNTPQSLWDELELVVTYGSAPAAGKYVDIYRIQALDSTPNYADGSSGASPVVNPAHYVGSFPLRAVTTAQRITITVPLRPSATFKYQLVNSAGQAMAASGNTLKRRPYRLQSA